MKKRVQWTIRDVYLIGLWVALICGIFAVLVTFVYFFGMPEYVHETESGTRPGAEVSPKSFGACVSMIILWSLTGTGLFVCLFLKAIEIFRKKYKGITKGK